jgi:hypothetical protein
MALKSNPNSHLLMASKNRVRFSPEFTTHYTASEKEQAHKAIQLSNINLILPQNNMMNNLLLTIITFLVACLATNDAFVPSARPIHSLQVKTALASTAADRSYLYRDEPTDLERKAMKEEHDVKHSTFHVEKGPMSVDNKNDPVHSVHHHLVTLDHDKLHDLELRAQRAWTPVNVHEVDVDAVSAAAALFTVFALVLILAGFAQ